MSALLEETNPSPQATADAVHTALRFLGNASSSISQEKRLRVAEHLNRDLKVVVEDESHFKEAAPMLFGRTFDKPIKNMWKRLDPCAKPQGSTHPQNHLRFFEETAPSTKAAGVAMHQRGGYRGKGRHHPYHQGKENFRRHRTPRRRSGPHRAIAVSENTLAIPIAIYCTTTHANCKCIVETKQFPWHTFQFKTCTTTKRHAHSCRNSKQEPALRRPPETLSDQLATDNPRPLGPDHDYWSQGRLPTQTMANTPSIGATLLRQGVSFSPIRDKGHAKQTSHLNNTPGTGKQRFPLTTVSSPPKKDGGQRPVIATEPFREGAEQQTLPRHDKTIQSDIVLDDRPMAMNDPRKVRDRHLYIQGTHSARCYHLCRGNSWSHYQGDTQRCRLEFRVCLPDILSQTHKGHILWNSSTVRFLRESINPTKNTLICETA